MSKFFETEQPDTCRSWPSACAALELLAAASEIATALTPAASTRAMPHIEGCAAQALAFMGSCNPCFATFSGSISLPIIDFWRLLYLR
ncbi:MAG: hypothetical protein JZU64_06475 [Rhodoferax sp.]|nr:hypothetical protein [Rhodoferax sp.]